MYEPPYHDNNINEQQLSAVQAWYHLPHQPKTASSTASGHLSTSFDLRVDFKRATKTTHGVETTDDY